MLVRAQAHIPSTPMAEHGPYALVFLASATFGDVWRLRNRCSPCGDAWACGDQCAPLPSLSGRVRSNNCCSCFRFLCSCIVWRRTQKRQKTNRRVATSRGNFGSNHFDLKTPRNRSNLCRCQRERAVGKVVFSLENREENIKTPIKKWRRPGSRGKKNIRMRLHAAFA